MLRSERSERARSTRPVCGRPSLRDRSLRAFRQDEAVAGKRSRGCAQRAVGRGRIHDVKQRSVVRSRGALLRPGLCPCDRVHPPRSPRRGVGGAPTGALSSCCRVCETRLIRASEARRVPMTRDARLSALHRGDFRPGAALPSPALPPDPCSELLAARSSCLAGGVPDLPSGAVTSRGRRTPLPAPPSGSSLEDAPPERGWQIIYYIFVT